MPVEIVDVPLFKSGGLNVINLMLIALVCTFLISIVWQMILEFVSGIILRVIS